MKTILIWFICSFLTFILMWLDDYLLGYKFHFINKESTDKKFQVAVCFLVLLSGPIGLAMTIGELISNNRIAALRNTTGEIETTQLFLGFEKHQTTQLFLGFEKHPVDLRAMQAEVGHGWSDIIEKLVQDLLELGWDGWAIQIKEKFGGLRFYIDTGSDAVHDRISQAETLSYQTCEECGAPGKPRTGGWIKTLCDEHALRSGKFTITNANGLYNFAEPGEDPVAHADDEI